MYIFTIFRHSNESARSNQPRIVDQLLTAAGSDVDNEYDSDDSTENPTFVPDSIKINDEDMAVFL